MREEVSPFFYSKLLNDISFIITENMSTLVIPIVMVCGNYAEIGRARICNTKRVESRWKAENTN